MQAALQPHLRASLHTYLAQSQHKTPSAFSQQMAISKPLSKDTVQFSGGESHKTTNDPKKNTQTPPSPFDENGDLKFMFDVDLDRDWNLPTEEELKEEAKTQQRQVEEELLKAKQKDFYNACKRGDVEYVKQKLQVGFNPYFCLEEDERRTPLMQASKKGHYALVDLLLEQNRQQLRLLNNFDSTALTYAAHGGHTPIADLLLRSGANPDFPNAYGQTPLMYAAEGNFPAMVRLLIDRGAAVDKGNRYGKTALIDAAALNSTDAAMALIERGAKVDNANIYGTTPLMVAARENQKEMVHLLLDNGAKPDRLNRDGQSALDLAKYKGNTEIVDILENALRSQKNIKMTSRSQSNPELIRGFNPPRVQIQADRPTKSQDLQPASQPSSLFTESWGTLQSPVTFNAQTQETQASSAEARWFDEMMSELREGSKTISN